MNKKVDLGINYKEVVSLLIDRRQSKYRPNSYSDGFKLGLVIEGGSLRGVISSAASAALHQLGFGKCFDSVYGNSSGSLNAAYFVSGQITYGTTVYYENATDPHFIKLLRWPDPLDINWLIDNWIQASEKSVSINSIMESDIDLHIATTNIQDGSLKYFSNRTHHKDLIIPALRASCSTPMLVTHKEPINGALYNDGLVGAAIPLQKALDDNCTHVLCLLTRPRGYRKSNSKVINILEKIRLRKYPKEYKLKYHARIDEYNRIMNLIYDKNDNMNILSIAPEPNDFLIKGSETRPEYLKCAAQESLLRVANRLGEDQSKVKLHGNR